MKVFFDTEFSGLHQGTTLISIGLVAESGEQMYCEFDDFDISQLNDWLRKNVLGNLWHQNPEISPPKHVKYVYDKTPVIKAELQEWLYQFGQVEMWSDVYAYDWVLFCNIWGTAFDIPTNVYYIPFDLATLLKIKGVDADVNREKFAGIDGIVKHNALADAISIKLCYERLQNLIPVPDHPDYLADTKQGKVYSLKRGFEELKSSASRGYRTISLYTDGISLSAGVHRVVMAAHLGTWNWDKPEVDHKDHNRANNSIDNLQLATRLEQMDEVARQKISESRKGFVLSEENKRKLLEANTGELNNKAKLTNEQVVEILLEYGEIDDVGKRQFSLSKAREYDVDPSTIRRILDRETWKHIKL